MHYEDQKEQYSRKLIRSASNGDDKLLRELLRQSPHGAQDSDALDEPLLKAAEHGHLESVRSLLSAGASTNAQNSRGESALHLAARNGFCNVVSLLLDNGADSELRDKEGGTALLQAVEAGQEDIVRFLVLERKNVDWNTVDTGKRTLLHAAAINGGVPIAAILLDSGIDIEAKGDHGETALTESARCGYTDMVQLLLRRGATCDAKDYQGWTALHWSSKKGHLAITQLLCMTYLEKGSSVDVRSNDQQTPLFRACDQQDVTIVRSLLDHGADVNAQDRGGETALFRATRKGDLDIVKLLLNSGARVDFATGDGRSALFDAVHNDDFDITGLLLENKANPRKATNKKWEPLLEAAKYDSSSSAALLLNPKVVQQYPADVLGEALCEAAKHDNVQVATLLLENGASVAKRGREGKTAIELAELNQGTRVISKLQQRAIFLCHGPPLQASVGQRGSAAKPIPFPRPPADVVDPCFGMTTVLMDFFQTGGVEERAIVNAPVQEVLYGRGPEALLLEHHPPGHERQSFRWIHLPANNLLWIKHLLARIYVERGPPERAQYYERKWQGLLAGDNWTGQQRKGSVFAPVHGRFIRPFCRRIEIDPDVSGGDRDSINMAVSMPYLHWETNKALTKMSKIIDLATQSYRAQRVSKANGRNKTKDYDSMDSDFDGVELATSIGAEWEEGVGYLAESALSATSEDVSGHKVPLDQETRQTTRRKRNEKFSKIDRRSGGADEKLILAYLWGRDPLHVRRTLDQYYYYILRDTTRRDNDQVVSRELEKQYGRKQRLVIIVDQLWLWTLDGDTVVSCFPSRWQKRYHPDADPDNVTDVLAELQGHLSKSARPPIRSVFDLNELIVNKCLRGVMNHTVSPPERLNFTELFENAIGSVSDREISSFNRFAKLSEQMRFDGEEHEIDTKRDELYYVDEETQCLKEIKDIRDELHILSALLNQQKEVLTEMSSKMKTMETISLNLQLAREGSEASSEGFNEHSRPGDELDAPDRAAMDWGAAGSQTNALNRKKTPSRQVATSRHLENLVIRPQRDIKRMENQAMRTYLALNDLLSLKQAQGNVLEARSARQQAEATNAQAEETSRQGKTILLFTIITVFFAPLSFLASFFALEIQGMKDLSDEYTLGYIFKIMFPVTFGVVALSIMLAFGPSFIRKPGLQWARATELLTFIRSIHKGIPSSKQEKQAKEAKSARLHSRGTTEKPRPTSSPTDSDDETSDSTEDRFGARSPRNLRNVKTSPAAKPRPRRHYLTKRASTYPLGLRADGQQRERPAPPEVFVSPKSLRGASDLESSRFEAELARQTQFEEQD